MNDAERKLVAALRSGFYAQTQESLRDKNGFCCLGVACDLYNPNLWNIEDGEIIYQFLNRETNLPKEVKNKLNWATSEGCTKIIPRKSPKCISSEYADFYNKYISLTELNDSGFTFDQIADIIEADLVLHVGNERFLWRSSEETHEKL